MPETTKESVTNSSTRPTRLVVIGCGNSSPGEDAAGVEIVCRLQTRHEPGCEMRVLPNAGPEILDLFDQADVVLFVDAVSSGAPPGTIHLARLPSPALEERFVSAVSSHGWGLKETLELAQCLGRRIPPMILLGVEIASALPAREKCMPVERAISTVVEHFARVRSWLAKTPECEWVSYQSWFPAETFFQGESDVLSRAR